MLQIQRSAVDLGIVCSNFEESLHFYRDLLGLEEALDIQIPKDVATGAGLAPREFRQVRLLAGDTLIKLMEIESPPEPRSFEFQSGVRWLTFIVANVPSLMRELQSRGVEFMAEPVCAPDAKHVVCAMAPDGMLIELVQLPDE